MNGMVLGTYQRKYPKGFAMRGWDPQNPTNLHTALPVARTADGRQQVIYAGQIVTGTDAGTKWQLGLPSDADLSNLLVAFAQDGTERFDVWCADSLVGLLCAGKYRFATPFFARYTNGTRTKSTDAGTPAVYTAGTLITVCKNGEKELVDRMNPVDGSTFQEEIDLAGFIRPAEAGDPILGVVAETHTGKNRALSATDAIKANNDVRKSGHLDSTPETQNYAWPLQRQIGNAEDSSSNWQNSYLVVWDTTYVPGNVVPNA